jgi:hypothetical protein
MTLEQLVESSAILFINGIANSAPLEQSVEIVIYANTLYDNVLEHVAPIAYALGFSMPEVQRALENYVEQFKDGIPLSQTKQCLYMPTT